MLLVGEKSFSTNVLESPQSVLVDFWAPWCGLCRLIEPVLLQLQSEWQGQLSLVRINADENLKLASTYRLRSLPTLILFEHGQVIHRLEGFQGKEDLYRTLNTVIAKPAPRSA